MKILAQILLILSIGLLSCQSGGNGKKLLIFSKTAGYRHASIEKGRAAVAKMAEDNGYVVDTTEDGNAFAIGNLKQYSALIFLNTTLDCLNDQQQLEMKRFIQAGGGFVGIHAAADTEYDWPWYGQLVGAYFKSHPGNPNVRDAIVDKVDHDHASCKHLPEEWARSDEWYNYKEIQPGINVLLNLDESSYEGGENGEHHPIAWYHEFDGGRSFYTGGGHTEESYDEPAFLKHILGGINYAVGDGVLDYSRASVEPEENRFQKVVLEDNLDEPMEFAMLPDHRILMIQRKGEIRLFDPAAGKSTEINKLEVYSGQEDGLLGMALDPNFDKNQWLYLFYSPPGEEHKQHISRFTFANDKVDFESEKVLLVIKTQRDECCHSGGCLEFGPDGNLFISAGDDTNPFKSNGYSPSDERPGRSAWDAQKSAANTNDLRGKVMRIKPEDDGSYSVPDGNLFPKDGSQGRPEIYAMGCRNPFRISIDQRTGYLYWGDVGPDAGKDSLGRGTRGHDEVNQAKKPGFFGWPYFNGDNKPYNEYDFATGESMALYDPEKPINNSPNNTGIRELPPATPAFIWYPYAESPEFPLVGTGGRNAMAGPIYYVDDYPASDVRFPAYYDKKIFTYDWIRGWIMSVSMDENGDFVRMERFLPSQKFNNPVDIMMSPEGEMFMLEYGTAWFSKNKDARLVHLKYIKGNRQPVAKASIDKFAGATPFTVQFSSDGTMDPDGDELFYEWDFADGGRSSEKHPSHVFQNAGTYKVVLTVKDADMLTSSVNVEVQAGNDPPELTWEIAGNKSFYWPNTDLKYDLKIEDHEDGTVHEGVALSINYLDKGSDINIASMGHEALAASSRAIAGKSIMDGSDCKSCHFEDQKSVGPSYRDVAKKYSQDPDARVYLADKVINGGGGVWGENAMAAHPQHSTEETGKMVEYILSLAHLPEPGDLLPLSGTYHFKAQNDNEEGSYILMATYTDQGATGAEPLTARNLLKLRSSVVDAVAFDTIAVATTDKLDKEQSADLKLQEGTEVLVANDQGMIGFKDIDLTHVASIQLSVILAPEILGGGSVQLSVDKPNGRVLSEIEIESAGSPYTKKVLMALEATIGVHDLFFTFKGNEKKPVCAILSMQFMKAESM